MTLVVRQLTNAGQGFYRLLGPFLARREVVAEVGGPIWDDDGKTWWVALAGGEVAGFCAATVPGAGGPVVFRSAYTLPGFRRAGVYRRLFSDRLAWSGGRPVRATCTAASLPMFERHGFTTVRTRGRFTDVHRHAATAAGQDQL